MTTEKTQARRCTTIERNELHFRYHKCRKKRLETHMQSAMPCKAQRNSEENTLNSSMSNSRERNEENVILKMLTKLTLTNLKDFAWWKAARKSTKNILKTVDTTQRVSTIWFICRYLSAKQWVFWERRWQWIRPRRSWTNCQLVKNPNPKVRNKKGVIEEAQEDSKTVLVAPLVDTDATVKTSELNDKFQKYWGRVVTQ